MAPDMPKLTSAADAVALLTVRAGEPEAGAPDLEALHLALASITGDVAAWPALLWLADVALSLLEDVTQDVPAAVRAIAVAVA